MKLHIRNMVSYRCQLMVKSVMDNLEIAYKSVELGEVDVNGQVPDERIEQFKADLLDIGLELLEDNNNILTERIKNAIIQIVYLSEEPIKVKLTSHLSEVLDHSYTYLANVFSKVTGRTIEQYIISLKIERVKELLIYDQLSLKEISFMLNYSSESHLSAQFKKVTGMSPTAFIKLKHKKRNYLSSI